MGGAYWLATRPAPGLDAAPAPGAATRPTINPTARLSPVQTVAADSRRVLPATAPDGSVRTAPVLPPLDEALGLDSGLAYPRRLQVVHALPTGELPTSQVDRLLAFVAEERSPAGLTIEQVRALKNDVLNVLVAQKRTVPGLTPLLRRIHADPAQDPGLRDYALQHLAALDALTANTDAAATAVHTAQWQAVAGSDSGLAATALRQLHLSAREGALSPDERTRLAQAAARLAADASRPETSRATALLICAELKLPEARPLAWTIARSEQSGVPFRVAAIATLGQLGAGDPAVEGLLRQLASGPEKRLRLPASAALKTLSL